MAPPKCFFKRPEEFYSSGNAILKSPKINWYNFPDGTARNLANMESLPTSNVTKSEPTLIGECLEYFHGSKSPTDPSTDFIERPLDLSFKSSDSNSLDFLTNLGSLLLQTQQQTTEFNQSLASNNHHYINLERLFSQLPQQLLSLQSAAQIIPQISVTPSPTKLDNTSVQSPFNQIVDSQHYLSPNSINDQFRDRSSSDSSSQYTTSQQRTRYTKRKVDGRQIRPFKLYKGNDTQGLMEALEINGEDDEWLRSIVEYKSVDDVFLFLTNCMNESTKPASISDDIINKIKARFGHIFQNCNTSISNPRMIRHPDMTPRELKTEEYWEKRRKNNDAAKRSREARRNKEDNLNQRCEKLQLENDCLRKEIERVKLRIEDIKRSVI